SLVAGKPVTGGGNPLIVRSPHTGAEAGRVATATRADVEAAMTAAKTFRDTPSRFQRSEILNTVRAALDAQREEIAQLITSEAGLAMRETRYEVGRTIEVLRWAAMEALRDD